MSQNELGKRAKVDRSILSRLEHGKTLIRASSLRKILAALDITPGSSAHVDAFALLAADTALASGVIPASRPALSKRIAAQSQVRAEEESDLIHRYRRLTDLQKSTIESLLKNPQAIDGLTIMLRASRR